MKILVACTHYPVASGRYIYRAFKRLGHDVRSIGDSTGNHIWNLYVDPRYAWEADGGLTMHWHDWTPDLVIIADSAWAFHHPYYAAVPHIVWGVDNHVRDYRQAGVARYFLGHKAVSLMQWQDDMEWLPCAYDPEHFAPSPIAWADREYDVCMLGVPYPYRHEVVQAFSDTDIKVVAGFGALYEQYANLYHNSRISLCVSANQDVAQRIFETAALGCAILTDPLPDLAEFDDAPAAVFSTPAEAVEQAQELLSKGKSAGTRLANKTAAWAAPHTWDARAARVVEWYNETYSKTEAGVTDGEHGNQNGDI